MSNRKSILPLIVASIVTLILINNRLANGQRQFFSRGARSEQKYCGKRMSEMLMLLCRGNYNPLFDKRTSQKIEDEYQALNEDTDAWMELRELDYPNPGTLIGSLSSNEFPMLSKSKGLVLGEDSFRRRRRNGIVEECCLKACSIDVLRMYCDNFRR